MLQLQLFFKEYINSLDSGQNCEGFWKKQQSALEVVFLASKLGKVIGLGPTGLAALSPQALSPLVLGRGIWPPTGASAFMVSLRSCHSLTLKFFFVFKL